MLFANGVPITRVMVGLAREGDHSHRLEVAYTTNETAVGASGQFCNLLSIEVGPDEPEIADLLEMMHVISYLLGDEEFTHGQVGRDFSFTRRPLVKVQEPGWFTITLVPDNFGAALHVTEEGEEDATPWEFRCPRLAAAIVVVMDHLMRLRPGYELTYTRPQEGELVRQHYTRIVETETSPATARSA